MRWLLGKSRGALVGAFVIILLAGATAIFLNNRAGQSGSEPRGRLLTASEMAWVVGDTPACDPCCKTKYNCASNFSMTDPTYKCFYCSVTSLTIYVCCSSHTDTNTCSNNGGYACDDNLIRWTGTQPGTPDGCGVYNSCGNATQNGTCGSGINQISATGTTCGS